MSGQKKRQFSPFVMLLIVGLCYRCPAEEEKDMDQIKIGAFLKSLRKEKEISQEELAEKFGVSSRSVSRWENGNTMPDISILVELADYYDVDIRELLNGERKNENMNEDMKETLTMVADYAEKQKKTGDNKSSNIVRSGNDLLRVYLRCGNFGAEKQRRNKCGVCSSTYVYLFLFFNPADDQCKGVYQQTPEERLTWKISKQVLKELFISFFLFTSKEYDFNHIVVMSFFTTKKNVTSL